jgi:hypothetical protein
VLDRSAMIDESLDEQVHTKIGVVKEEDFTHLQEYDIETPKPEVGLYSDNFIGLNPILYNPVFKSAGKQETTYPKY